MFHLLGQNCDNDFVHTSYVWKLHDDSNDYNGTFCKALIIITKELIIIHLFFNAYRLLIDTNIIAIKSMMSLLCHCLFISQM